MKTAILHLTASALLTTSTAQAEIESVILPTDAEIIETTTQLGLQKSTEKNLWGIFGFLNRCRYAINTPDKVTRGTIALTFDDGPNPETTPVILEVLKAHRASATFFTMGGKIKGNEELLKRIVEEGHILANHSYSHPNFHNISSSREESEVVSTHKLLTNFTYPRFFRYPFGNSTCGANQMIEGLGYSIVGWNIDTCDWAFADGYVSDSENQTCQAPSSLRKDYTGYVLSQVKQTQGGILLMHDIHKNTAESLDRLLTILAQEGYRFVALDDVNIFPLLNKR